MARIPLRAYAREVENLIEHGQIEEAIAHAKNILKQFPKYIEAYRLLAKAYLESQRYTEALDILQRILSVFPDDFIAHLGMSIIREDEGNLDAAIWHMERAYEVQPFNRAVQDELRRLYGRRDGVEPPRIRLTRGALVRMYDRGGLYPQAIAEIRAALAEDGARLDLLVLLARMYYLSGQKIEAAEVASSLISKLPYCYEANKILAEVLPETSRADDAPLFKQRLLALDPYMGFISPNAPTSDQVPEQNVMVEHLDWVPSMMEEAAPEWTKTIGVEWEESRQEEELPDWLNALAQPTEPQPSTSVSTPAAPPPPADEVLPDFLKSAGWVPSQGENIEAEQGTLVSGILEEEAPEAEPVEAEIPDWLKSLAPSGIEKTNEIQEPGEVEEERLGWLEDILPSTPSTTGAEQESKTETPDWLFTTETSEKILSESEELEEIPSSEETLPDWLSSEFPASESTITSTQEEIPDWLSTIESQSGEKTEEIPEWLKATPIEEAEGASGIEEVLPPWLETAPEKSEEELSGQSEASEWLPEGEEPLAPPIQAEVEQAPEWISALETSTFEEQTLTPPEEILATAQPEAGVSETPPEDLDAALAWMEALAARQGAPEETLTISTPEQRTEEIPEWLKGQIEQPVGTEEMPAEIEESQATPEPSSELTAGEPELTIQEQSQAEAVLEGEAAEQSPSLSDLDAALAWMEALAARQGAEPETLTITPPEQRQETPPEWIKEELQETKLEDMVSQPTSASEVNETLSARTEEKSLDEMTPDEAFAWLESLAARQGAQEGTLITSEEERPEVPQITETHLEEISEVEQELPPIFEDKAEAWIPEETYTASIPEEAQPSIEEQQERVEIPEWLKSYEEEQKAQPPVWEPTTLEINPEEVPDEALPEWLRVMPEEEETIPVTQPPWEESALPLQETAVSAEEIAPSSELVYSGEGEPSSAWILLQEGNISKASQAYEEMIQARTDLDKVIHELEEAVKHHPKEITLWQTLGDAYFRADQVAKALEAYTKAEELLS